MKIGAVNRVGIISLSVVLLLLMGMTFSDAFLGVKANAGASVASPFFPIGTISVGSGPVNAVISPNGNYEWVTNDNDYTITQIDLTQSTPVVLNTIALPNGNGGWGPYGIAINSAGTQVWASNASNGSVVEINTADCVTLNEVSCVVHETVAGLAGNPFGVSISPDGSDVWVSDWNSSDVYEISTTTYQVINTVLVGLNPHAVLTAPNPTNPSDYYVWVADNSDGAVSYIDAAHCVATNDPSCIQSNFIATGSDTNELAASSDGSSVWVTNWGSGSISEINASTKAVVQSVNVGGNPFGITISPDASQVWVSNWNNVLTEVLPSGSSATIGQTITEGSNQNGLVMSPDGTELFVVNGGNNNVAEYSNVNTLSVPGAPSQPVVTAGRGQASVAWDLPSAGGGFITNYTAIAVDQGSPSSTFSCVTPAMTCVITGLSTHSTYTVTVTAANATGSGPASIESNTFTPNVWTPGAVASETSLGAGSTNSAFSPDGNYLWVANDSDGTVSQVLLTGSAPALLNTITLGLGPNGWGPYAVAVSPDGAQVWVTNGSNNSVVEIDAANCVSANSTACLVSHTVTGLLGNPFGVSVSPDGSNVWVSDWNSSYVYEVSTSTYDIVNRVTVGTNPHAVITAPNPTNPSDYYVWVADNSDRAVSYIDAAHCVATNDPSCIQSNFIATGSDTNELAASSDGSSVWVTNWGSGSISEINASTKAVILTLSVGGNPYGITITPDNSTLWVTNWNGQLSEVDLTGPTPSIVQQLTSITSSDQQEGVSVSPSGAYIFVTTAGNGGSGPGPLFQIVNKIKPTSPGNFSITPGVKSAEFHWRAPSNDGGSSISNYVVTAVDTNNHHVATCRSATTSCALTGLIPGDGYTASVRAQNQVGLSPASSDQSATPFDVPTQPSQVIASEGEVSLARSHAQKKSSAKQSRAMTGHTAAAPDYTCTVTQLSPGSQNYFEVLAYDQGGSGPPSSISQKVLASSANSDSATISWNSASASGTSISYYQVKVLTPSSLGIYQAPTSGSCVGNISTPGVQPGSGGGSGGGTGGGSATTTTTTTTTVPPTTTTTTTTTVPPPTTTTTRPAAGGGSASTTTTTTTTVPPPTTTLKSDTGKSVLPSSPTIKVVSSKTGELDISLVKAISAGAKPITSYQYSLSGGSWRSIVRLRNGTFVLTKLLSGKTYSLRLRAVSSIGVGSPSSQFSIRVK